MEDQDRKGEHMKPDLRKITRYKLDTKRENI
jgi:hypothetical protein